MKQTILENVDQTKARLKKMGFKKVYVLLNKGICPVCNKKQIRRVSGYGFDSLLCHSCSSMLYVAASGNSPIYMEKNCGQKNEGGKNNEIY